MTNLPPAVKVANRAEGLRRLADFQSRAGNSYRELRGFDFGPQRRDNVSGLSPYLRYGLLSPAEVVEAVLAEHGPSKSEACLSELLMRTYWKGWMEGRPQVYMAYRRALGDDLRRFKGTQSYAAALEGRTGISAFDAWNQELLDTGYLHHRARMWYASIWIFTLRLPWTLGVAHFHEHLLDGDPASNTLSWRWVAGLHTPGKHFLAKAEEIAKGSAGRFELKGRLNESAVALTGPPVPASRLLQLPQAPSAALGDRYALLVTPDDLTPELAGTGLKPQLVLTCGFESVDQSYSFSPKVRDFVSQGLDDAKQRLSEAYSCPVVPIPIGAQPGALLGQHLTQEGLPHLVYFQPGVGPWQELLAGLTSKDVGLRYFPLRRAWDSRFFPLAENSPGQFQKAALPMLTKARSKAATATKTKKI
jgi:deoxyribodipyrimidine photo-lyase